MESKANLFAVLIITALFTFPSLPSHAQKGAAIVPVLQLLLETDAFLLEADTFCSGSSSSSISEFVTAPYAFSNGTLTSANPKSVPSGSCVVWVDQQNLDNSPTDFTPNGNESFATRDIFMLKLDTGEVLRVSDPMANNVASGGNREAASPAISDDGGKVAYVQEGVQTTFVGAGDFTLGDVYVRNMEDLDSAPIQVNIAENGAVGAAGTPISNDSLGNSSGARANESLQVIDISGDGNKVVFISNQALSTDDNNGSNDVYLRDLSSNTTELVSVLNGTAGGGVATHVRTSSNGRYVAFSSTTDYTVGETSQSSPADSPDIYLVDTSNGNIALVSGRATGQTGGFDMSADASRMVIASNEGLLPSDTNESFDVYLVEMDLTNFVVSSRERISVADGGFEVFGGDSFTPSISPNGNQVAFVSTAKDLADYREDYVNSVEQAFLINLDDGVLLQPAPTRATADEPGLSSHIELANNGFFYRKTLSAGSGSPTTSDSITAGVAISASGVDDIGTIEIKAFQPVRSRVDSASDVDIFELKGTGQALTLEVAIEAVDSNGGTLPDPFIRILRRSSNGAFNVVAVDNDSAAGRDSLVYIDLPASGSLFIEVSSADGSTGSYRLRVAGPDELFL